LKKKTQKNEKKNNFGRKKAKKIGKNGKKKHAGKVKAEFSTNSILKKKKLDKNNFETKHVGKHCSKTCRETL
jgi:hypothetical protein